MGRYRTTTAGGLVEESSTNLALCVAKARALRQRGYPAFVKDETGFTVELKGRADDELRFVAPDDDDEFRKPWPDIARRLLATAVQD